MKKKNIFFLLLFKKKKNFLGTFTLWSRIEEEEYFLSASFQKKKKKNIFLLNTKYATSRKGVVPLIYPQENQDQISSIWDYQNNVSYRSGLSLILCWDE